MAKKEASKTKQALEKKNTAEIEKAVTFDSMSIEAKDVFKNKLLMLPVPMYVTSLNQCNKIAFLKVA